MLSCNEYQPSLLKIPVKGLDAPLKIYIHYVDDALDEEEAARERRLSRRRPFVNETVKRKRKCDLEIYISETIEQPSAEKYDKNYLNAPEVMVLHSVDDSGARVKKFEHDFFYIALYSEQGTLIKLNAMSAPPPAVVVKDWDELTAMLPANGEQSPNKNVQRSAKSKLIGILLQIYMLQGGNAKKAKMSELLNILTDESIMKDIIPKNDPFYLEMQERTR